MEGSGQLPSRDGIEIGVVEHADRHLRLRIAGELDAATAGPLLEALEAATGAHIRHLEIDMAEVTFIDSTGLGVLVRAHNRLAKLPDAQPLALVSPRPQARKVLEITGLTRVFEVREA